MRSGDLKDILATIALPLVAMAAIGAGTLAAAVMAPWWLIENRRRAIRDRKAS
jgi:hypothetical protein